MWIAALLLALAASASFSGPPSECPVAHTTPACNSYATPNSWAFFWNMMASPDVHTLLQRNFFKDDEAIAQTRVKFMGVDVVAVADKELAAQIVGDPESFPNASRTLPKFQGILDALTKTLLLDMNGEEVKRYRTILSSSFSGINTKEAFEEVASNLCHYLKMGTQVDVFDAFQRTAMDAMGKALMGLELNTLTGDSQILTDYRAFNSYLSPKIVLYPSFMIDQVITLIKKFKKHLETAYDNYPVGNNSRLLLSVLKNKNVKGEITKDEAIDLMTFMFVAGQETTAVTLASLAYYLAKNPVNRSNCHCLGDSSSGARGNYRSTGYWNTEELHQGDPALESTLFYPSG